MNYYAHSLNNFMGVWSPSSKFSFVEVNLRITHE